MENQTNNSTRTINPYEIRKCRFPQEFSKKGIIIETIENLALRLCLPGILGQNLAAFSQIPIEPMSINYGITKRKTNPYLRFLVGDAEN